MRSFIFLSFVFSIAACTPGISGSAPDDSNLSPVAMGDGDDLDGDGYGERVDCDDADVNVNPGEEETCADGIDNDCDGDIDGADSNANRAPHGFDGDGDGLIQDYDGDGVITSDDLVQLCDSSDADIIAAQTGGDTALTGSYIEVSDSGFPDYAYPDADCDDTNDAVYPGAPELCDDVDNDCDEATGIDEDAVDMTTFYTDWDGDGYGESGSSGWEACDASEGSADNDGDCDDAVWEINPGATEVCDELDTDEDCSGAADDWDEGTSSEGMSEWYVDADLDGHGGTSEGLSCDGSEDAVLTADDCDDDNAAIHPHATEICDGVDNDCDASTEDTQTWYHDADADDYGTSDLSVTSCTQPATYVANADDCDDTDDEVSPDGLEVMNGIDDDCDELVDADDDSLACMIEINIRSGSTVPVVEINGTVSSDSALDGEWYDAGVEGVTVTSTSDSSGELYIVELDACLSPSDMITLDVVYEDGERGCHTDMSPARGAVSAWEDFTALNAYNGTDPVDADGYYCNIEITEAVVE